MGIPLQTAKPENKEQMWELYFDWYHSLTHITLAYLHYVCINPIQLRQLFLFYLCILSLFTCKVVWYGWIIIFLYLKPVYIFSYIVPLTGFFCTKFCCAFVIFPNDLTCYFTCIWVLRDPQTTPMSTCMWVPSSVTQCPQCEF